MYKLIHLLFLCNVLQHSIFHLSIFTVMYINSRKKFVLVVRLWKFGQKGSDGINRSEQCYVHATKILQYTYAVCEKKIIIILLVLLSEPFSSWPMYKPPMIAWMIVQLNHPLIIFFTLFIPLICLTFKVHSSPYIMCSCWNYRYTLLFC